MSSDPDQTLRLVVSHKLTETASANSCCSVFHSSIVKVLLATYCKTVLLEIRAISLSFKTVKSTSRTFLPRRNWECLLDSQWSVASGERDGISLRDRTDATHDNKEGNRFIPPGGTLTLDLAPGYGSHFPLILSSTHDNKGDHIFIPSGTLVTGVVYHT